MFARNEWLSLLQRRSILLLSCSLLLTMFLFMVAHDAPQHFSVARPLLRVLQVLPAIPLAAMALIAGRYLARETNEFIRMVVIQSMLWGLGVTMVANIVRGVLFENGNACGPSQICDIDVFFATALVALAAQLRRTA